MSASGLEVFDKTLQTTHIWLNEIASELGPDRQRAYHALRAVLHALRDRLTIEQGAHLSAQLPMLVRGIYYEGWHPKPETSRERKREEFLSRIEAELGQIRPISTEDAARAVFGVIGRHVTGGEVEKVRRALPQDIRGLWPES